MIYVEIKDNKVIMSTPFLDIAQEEFENYITTDFEDYTPSNNKYMFDGENIVLNPNYEQELKEEERKILNGMSLTKREVFLALYEDKGITPAQLKAQITEEKALIEFEYANEYLRGNPLIDLIGQKLGYTSEELDYLFEHGRFEEND